MDCHCLAFKWPLPTRNWILLWPCKMVPHYTACMCVCACVCEWGPPKTTNLHPNILSFKPQKWLQDGRMITSFITCQHRCPSPSQFLLKWTINVNDFSWCTSSPWPKLAPFFWIKTRTLNCGRRLSKIESDMLHLLDLLCKYIGTDKSEPQCQPVRLLCNTWAVHVGVVSGEALFYIKPRMVGKIKRVRQKLHQRAVKCNDGDEVSAAPCLEKAPTAAEGDGLKCPLYDSNRSVAFSHKPEPGGGMKVPLTSGTQGLWKRRQHTHYVVTIYLQVVGGLMPI